MTFRRAATRSRAYHADPPAVVTEESFEHSVLIRPRAGVPHTGLLTLPNRCFRSTVPGHPSDPAWRDIRYC